MAKRLLPLLALLFVLGVPASHAQPYPAHAIKMIVPFPPGGATDVVGRIVANKLSERMGQPVVVDNKPGAGGALGSEVAAHSAPDGYTILMATSSTHSIGPNLQKLGYDPVRDFAPVCHVADVPNVLVVSPALPVHSVAELVAYAKARPGQLNFASSGVGTIVHLNAELFKMVSGVDMVHVPYKGTALAIPDIANGSVAMVFDSLASVLPHIKSGKVRPIALNANRRSPLLPELPTLAEAGMPQFNVYTWFGAFAPAGTPAAVVARLNAEIQAALKDPVLLERFAAVGAEPAGGPPEALLARVRNDGARWAEVIRAANVKVQ